MWITIIGLVLIGLLVLNLGYTIFDHE